MTDSRNTHTLPEFAARSRRLQALLRDAGYRKGSGVSTAGIRLVSRVAARQGIRDWPHTRTLADYDALIAAVSADLTSRRPMPTEPKAKWPNSAAARVASELCNRLAPFCADVMVAGSLRRGRPEVGDVEILYISRMEERPLDLFATAAVYLAEEEIDRMLADGTLTKRPSKTGRTSWGEQNKLALHQSGIPVDLFRTEPASWWNYLVCRTGPAASNARIATEAQRRGYKWNPYGPGFTRLSDGTVAAMDSEEAVFAFVGLPYADPRNRD